jgi:hypothetical protein
MLPSESSIQVRGRQPAQERPVGGPQLPVIGGNGLQVAVAAVIPAGRKIAERVSRPVTSLSGTIHRRPTQDRSFSVAAGAALRPREAKQGQAVG